MRKRQIVILGNGIAGATAACRIRERSDDRIVMVSGETEVPFSRTALMYLFMGDLRFENTKLREDPFWTARNIELKHAWVTRIDHAGKRLELESGESLEYDVLILATGSKANRFGWPGQDLDGVQSLYRFQDLELLEETVPRCRHGVIVGGGLIGVELAEMLLTRGIGVTFLVREPVYWGKVLSPKEGALVVREMERHGVDVRLSTELESIVGDTDGRVCGVRTRTGDDLSCEVVGLTAGVQPNIELVKASGIECGKGVLVDRHLRTSAAGVYAAGDCVEVREPAPGRRAIEPVWYVGRIMGETVAANICGEALAYDPGVWFNSAKFFDIEYQTYGDAPSSPGDGFEEFYWEDPMGRKSMRISFRSDGGGVSGMTVLGMRQRHAVWEEWILRGAKIGEVMENLGAANFDPEFFPRHEEAIVSEFNAQHPSRAVTLRTRKGLFSNYLKRLFGGRSSEAA